MSQAKDRRVQSSSETSHLKLVHSHEVPTVGELLYRMTGLLILQELYAGLLDEQRSLEAYLAKQRLQYRVRDHLADSDKNSLTTVEEASVLNEVDRNSSLLSSLHQGMHLQLAKYKRVMAESEGKMAHGLIQENHELKQSYHHQQKYIEELEQELKLYYQRSPPDQAFNDEHIVRKLSESNKLLSVQKTLAHELGIQLEQRSREVDVLQEKLALEQFGRRQAQAQINTLLNEFVLCCLQIPEIAKDFNAKQAFDNLLSKSKTLCKFDVEVAVAVQLASEDSALTDFLQSESPTAHEENFSDISLDQAQEKISKLLISEQRLRHEAKHQVTEQMRKHKIAELKVKDLEERLKKCTADKQLIEESLRNEIHKLRSQLDALEQTLGHRSSYAAKAAQSVRSLIEFTEGQKMELEYQRNCLRTELADLQQNQEELQSRNEQLKAEISRLNVTALKEATERVRGTLDALESQCNSLRNENKTLEEQLDVLQETLKRERDIRRSTENSLHRLEQQVEEQQTELKQLKAANTSLVASKQQMEAKINALETSKKESIRNLQPRQGSVQHVSGGVSYLTRELPEPELIPRSSLSSMSSRQQQHLGSSEPRTEDVVMIGAQSLAPPVNLYSQSRYSSSNDRNQESRSAVRYKSLPSRSGGIESGFASKSGDWSSMWDVPRTALLRSPTRDTMQCLRCGSKFSITNLDGYERHIKDCYSDVR